MNLRDYMHPSDEARMLQDVRITWDALARKDALYAIASMPGKKGQWRLPDFLATGERQIFTLRERMDALGLGLRGKRALDFGCGVGRLTQPLSALYQEVIGLDVSESMVNEAERINQHGSRCRYIVSSDLHLPFLDAHFDLVHTCITLQHMPEQLQLSYLAEFCRVTRPGGIIYFQIVHPHRSSISVRQMARKWVPATLAVWFRKRAGVGALFPATEMGVRDVVMRRGATILTVEKGDSGKGIQSAEYFARRDSPRRLQGSG